VVLKNVSRARTSTHVVYSIFAALFALDVCLIWDSFRVGGNLRFCPFLPLLHHLLSTSAMSHFFEQCCGVPAKGARGRRSSSVKAPQIPFKTPAGGGSMSEADYVRLYRDSRTGKSPLAGSKYSPYHFNLPKSTRNQIDRRLKLIRQREFDMQKQEEELTCAREQIKQQQLEMRRQQLQMNEMMNAMKASSSSVESSPAHSAPATPGLTPGLTPPIFHSAGKVNGNGHNDSGESLQHADYARNGTGDDDQVMDDVSSSDPIPKSVSGDMHLPAGMPELQDSSDEEDDDVRGAEYIEETSPEMAIQTGVDCFSCGMYSHAKKHLKRAVMLSRGGKDYLLIARAYGNLANVYETLGASDKAVVYYEASIGLLQRLGETRRESFILGNAIVSFIQLKQYENALRLAERKLEILDDDGKRDQAILWIRKLENAVLGNVDLVFEGDAKNRRALVVSQKLRTPR